MRAPASPIGATLVVSVLWLSTLLLSYKVEAQIPGNRVYACSLDRTGLDGTVVAERSAMTDLDAPVLHSAWFAPNGLIVEVDRTAKRVMVLDTDLNLVRDIGRHGPGPGEYADPMAAVMDGNGRILVADGAGGYGSVIVYGEDGGFVREDALRMTLTPSGMATDGEVVGRRQRRCLRRVHRRL